MPVDCERDSSRGFATTVPAGHRATNVQDAKRVNPLRQIWMNDVVDIIAAVDKWTVMVYGAILQLLIRRILCPGICMNVIFKLNVMVVKNEINKINSSTYLIESSNMWHARLGHKIKVVRSEEEVIRVFIRRSYVRNMENKDTSSLRPMHLRQKRYCRKEYIDYLEGMVVVPTPKAQKIGPKAVNCIFIGYAKNSSAYRFIVHESKNPDIQKNTIMESRKMLPKLRTPIEPINGRRWAEWLLSIRIEDKQGGLKPELSHNLTMWQSKIHCGSVSKALAESYVQPKGKGKDKKEDDKKSKGRSEYLSFKMGFVKQKFQGICYNFDTAQRSVSDVGAYDLLEVNLCRAVDNRQELYMGYSATADIKGEGDVVLKMTSEKELKLTNVLYVLEILYVGKGYAMNDEAIDKFVLYKNKVENQLGKKIKVVRSDRGGEYVFPFSELCAQPRIRHEFTAPYSPQQNGIAEREEPYLEGNGYCHVD
ncbi:retrotransposon protein, putative, ty1-copia subclass [Tanacetum coccineum]